MFSSSASTKRHSRHRKYFRFYGLRLEHLELAKPDAIVMHPGPINRGRELSTEVADSQRSVILNQVENGIAVRMAVLERMLGCNDERCSFTAGR